MSVSSIVLPKYYPYNRITDKKVPLIGKWYHGSSLNMDASGGDATMGVDMAGGLATIGNKLLFTVDIATFQITSSLVGYYANLYIVEAVMSYSGSGFMPYIFRYLMDSEACRLDNMLPKGLFRLSPELTQQVYIVVGPNTNGKAMTVQMAGRIYDERYLEDFQG